MKDEVPRAALLELPADQRVMKDTTMTQRTVSELVGQRLELTLPEATTTLQIFEWDSLADARRQEIFEYYLDDEGEEAVGDGRWVPIGVLGLAHGAGSFAEMNHDGLLVQASKGKPSGVLRVNEDEVTVLGEDLDALALAFPEAKKARGERYLQPPFESLWKSSLEKSGRDDYAGAVADLHELLEALPDEARVHRALADCYFMAAQYPEALVAADRALELSPEPQSRFTRVATLMRMDRIGEALDEVSRMSSESLSDSDEAQRLALEGVCTYRLGNEAAAKRLVQQSAEKDDMILLPDDVTAIYERLLA